MTAIRAQPGELLRTGSPLVSVDGITLLAQVGGIPYYRVLERGARGEDVVQLNNFLAAEGYSAIAGSDLFDRTTQSAVKSLQASVGAPSDGVFTPSLFAYVAESSAQVLGPLVNVGDPVAQGASLFSVPRAVTSAALVPTDTAKSLTQFGESAVTLFYGSDGVSLAGTEIGETELGVVLDLIGEGIASGSLSQSEEGDSKDVTGLFLGLSTPLEVGTVPGEAIYISQSGVQCVFLGSSVERAAATVLSTIDLPSSEVGVAFVDLDLVGEILIRNPAFLPDEVLQQCK